MTAAARSRADLIVLGSGAGLIVGLLAFPWYSEAGRTLANLHVAGYSATATSAPYAVWGILALILTIAAATDLGLARWRPTVLVAATPAQRDLARAVICGLMALALVVKFIAHVGSLGWGVYVDGALALAMTVAAWLAAEEARGS